MEAAAMELEGFKRFKGFKGTREGYVQANAAKADGQSFKGLKPGKRQA